MLENLIVGGRSFANSLTELLGMQSVKFLGSNDLDKFIPHPQTKNIIISGSPALARTRGFTIDSSQFEENIERLIRKARPSKVIFISSAAVYGTVSKLDLPLKESSPLKGTSDYALEKKALELKLRLLKEDNCIKKLLILRPAGFYGGNDPNSLSLIDRVIGIREQKSPVEKLKIDNHGEQVRDFCGREQFLKLIKLLLTSDFESNTYNFKTTKGIKVSHLLEKVLQPSDYFYIKEKVISSEIHSELDISLIARNIFSGRDFIFEDLLKNFTES